MGNWGYNRTYRSYDSSGSDYTPRKMMVGRMQTSFRKVTFSGGYVQLQVGSRLSIKSYHSKENLLNNLGVDIIISTSQNPRSKYRWSSKILAWVNKVVAHAACEIYEEPISSYYTCQHPVALEYDAVQPIHCGGPIIVCCITWNKINKISCMCRHTTLNPKGFIFCTEKKLDKSTRTI